MIGSTIAPIFFNTMEDSGALPLEMDVKDLAMGDLIDLCVYEQVVKKHGTSDVLVNFGLKHELMLDQAMTWDLKIGETMGDPWPIAILIWTIWMTIHLGGTRVPYLSYFQNPHVTTTSV